jgi:hypothetical protein
LDHRAGGVRPIGDLDRNDRDVEARESQSHGQSGDRATGTNRNEHRGRFRKGAGADVGGELGPRTRRAQVTRAAAPTDWQKGQTNAAAHPRRERGHRRQLEAR